MRCNGASNALPGEQAELMGADRACLTRVTRRTTLRLFALGSGAAFLVGCGLGSPPTASLPTQLPSTPASTAAPSSAASAASSATTPAAQQPKYGGTLRIGILADVANVDGHSRGGGSAESFWMIFDRLIKLDEKLTPQPMLAESIDLSSDYTQVKFNLRKGVQWHSGRDFTSDDVKWNLLRVRDPKVGGGNFTNQSNWFTTLDTPDKYTIVLGSDASRPAMFDLFENLNMVDRDFIDGPDKSKAGGTGPFALQEWVQGDHLTFVKNQNYWQSGRPYLDSVISSVRNEQTATMQLEAGALDLFRISQPGEITRLKADPKFQLFDHPYPGTDYEIIINTTVPPFDNKMVRQALNYALDRQRLVEQIYLNTNKAQNLPWSPSSPAYDAAKNNTYAFDLDKARSLLKAVNVSSATTDLIFISGVTPLMETFMQIYQADLAQIGVTLNIVPMEAAAWLDQIFGRKYRSMMSSGDNSMNLSPGTPLNAGPSWKQMPNTSGFDDPTWTGMLASVASETDLSKQNALYAQINDFILDQCWDMPVCSIPYTLIATSAVHGVLPSMHATFMFSDTWLDT
jgi:peptide/nickel transport system substrate-binding protein